MSNSFYLPNESIKNKLIKLIDTLEENFSNNITSVQNSLGEVCITIPKESLLDIINFLRDDSRFLFRQLTDITAIDYPEKRSRFVLVYQLLSLSFNLRVRLKINIEENYVVPSLFNYYSNADWLEREVYDMFGIYFGNHPDLRRILTDFGFEGFPLRKDFPLSGFTEVYYDEIEKQVKYKPIELEQEYRDFNSLNPWIDFAKRKEN